MKRFLLFLFAAVCALASTPREAHFIDSNYASRVNAPTCLAWAPDGSGRLFVSLKGRGIGVIENGAMRSMLFATFSPLFAQSECGVLGLAFDPDFATNHYVYVFVTVSASEQQIMRFTDQDSVGVDRTILIRGLPTRGRNHNGGALAFGPDGKLYWAVGDNGVKRGVDGDLTSLAAKVGRCNPDGSVPNDNPFNDGSGPNNDYIWATGFRNPFTMTFHPVTGELWLNVVGSNPGGQTSPRTTAGYEQVFALHAGDDGGYDNYEGNQPGTPRFTTPFPRPCVQPRMQYRTSYAKNGSQLRTITHAGPDGSGHLLVSLGKAHGFRVGEAVTITGAGPYNGQNVVQALPSANEVLLVLPEGETAEMTAGRIDSTPFGNCVVGGCFYDGASFPAEYTGNFFYGDLTGRIIRTQFDAEGKPHHTTVFASDAAGITDLVVGPDGALYYCSVLSQSIRRLAFNATPDVLVAPTRLALAEGGRGTVNVRLAAPPASDTPLFVRRAEAADSGHHFEIPSGATLNFTRDNWNRTQPVTITSPLDDDTLNESGSLIFHAPGYRKATVTATAKDSNLPRIVFSATNVALDEGGTVEIQASLRAAPTKNITVTARRIAGPVGKVQITQGSALVFGPANWNTPATIVLTGLQDANKDPEIVDLQWTAPGYRPTNVRVTLRDNDPRAPTFTSSPLLNAVEGRTYLYPAAVRALPAPVFSLVAAPAGMNVDPDTGLLTWIPAALGDFDVTLRATNAAGLANQSFSIHVSRDHAPSAFILEPADGAVLSGAQGDFWGAGIDDHDTVKAEFYLDDVLLDTETLRSSLYQFGGAPRLFDTTLFANGPHVLKMVVFDEAGQAAEASVSVTIQN